jgi:hyperosmotically inducible protein
MHPRKRIILKFSKNSAQNRSLWALLLLVTVAFMTTACATNRSANNQMTDSAITGKIKAKFTGDPEINPFNIDVDTIDGNVRLSGTVDDQATRAEAAKLAHDTTGVRRVTNAIKVGERTVGEEMDDAGITFRVKAMITANGDLNPLNIDVDTQDGVVTLSGMVADSGRVKLAADVAKTVSGVKSVDNRLTVKKG